MKGFAPRPPIRRKAGAPAPAPAPAPATGAPTPEPRESAAPESERYPVEVYEAQEIRDAWESLFEALEEGFGPEFHVEPKKLDRMGDRWARLLNKMGRNVAMRAVVSLFGKFFLILAVLQPLTILAGAGFKRWKRYRAEKDAPLVNAGAPGPKRDGAVGQRQPSSNVTPIGPRTADA